MKVIKKWTAIQISSNENTQNEEKVVNLSYGSIGGPYYSREYPKEIFDTEEEAIEYAYKKDKWLNWIILPIIYFDNF